MEVETTSVIKESLPLEKVKETRPQKVSIPQKTVRIHVDTSNQPRPVIFNYRQLYKRELKKMETTEETVPMSVVETQDDLFFKGLLEKAESYAMEGDDVDDVGSDEEASLVHLFLKWMN